MDISTFADWCDQTAATIAGKPIEEKQTFTLSQLLPQVLKMAFEALLNGLPVGTTGRRRSGKGIVVFG